MNVSAATTRDVPKLHPGAPQPIVGVVGNQPHQGAGVIDRGTYELAFVEFDDQGRCHDRRQMHAVTQWLDSHKDTDATIVVFVHGWKHDARGDDENLRDFCHVLDTVGAAPVPDGVGDRAFLGIFVGWRGMSLHDCLRFSENATFWDRQEAGRRVSVGSVRELFGHLRHYRNRRKDAGGKPIVAMVGHSFGGMIVYSALAQSLIEAAAAPTDEIVSRFADLVLLINPAVEAARYLPIYDILRERKANKQETAQAPLFVCVTAANDWATKYAFAVGNFFSWVSESWRDREERDAMTNTIGHVPWMKTHDLAFDPATKRARLSPVAPGQAPPFWIAQATPEIVDGHNGIHKPAFVDFVVNLLVHRIQAMVATK